MHQPYLFRRLPTVPVLVFFVLYFCPLSPVRGESAVAQPVSLSLKEFEQRVLDYNEGLQVRMLQVEVARRSVNAERGVFEPELVGSVDHEENKRPKYGGTTKIFARRKAPRSSMNVTIFTRVDWSH